MDREGRLLCIKFYYFLLCDGEKCDIIGIVNNRRDYREKSENSFFFGFGYVVGTVGKFLWCK